MSSAWVSRQENLDRLSVPTSPPQQFPRYSIMESVAPIGWLRFNSKLQARAKLWVAIMLVAFFRSAFRNEGEKKQVTHRAQQVLCKSCSNNNTTILPVYIFKQYSHVIRIRSLRPWWQKSDVDDRSRVSTDRLWNRACSYTVTVVTFSFGECFITQLFTALVNAVI